MAAQIIPIPRPRRVDETPLAWLQGIANDVEAGRHGETPAASGIALPHILLDNVTRYELVAARSHRGLHFPGIGAHIHAVFVLLGSKDDPQQPAAPAGRQDSSALLPRLPPGFR